MPTYWVQKVHRTCEICSLCARKNWTQQLFQRMILIVLLSIHEYLKTNAQKYVLVIAT